jgi:adenylyltransferase/sulfurtransferase
MATCTPAAPEVGVRVVMTGGPGARGDDFVLIDMREPHEYKICNIRAARLIPLGEICKRLGELNPDADIVIHCKSGMRSARTSGILKAAGFKQVRNMKGGILAWSDRVDSSVPKH